MDFTPTGPHYVVKDVTLLDEEAETFTAVVVQPSQSIKSPFWSGTAVVLDTYPKRVGQNQYVAHESDIIAFQK